MSKKIFPLKIIDSKGKETVIIADRSFKYFYKASLIICFLSFFYSQCQYFHYRGSAGIIEKVSTSVRKIYTLSDQWRFQLDIGDVGEKERWFEKDFNEWGFVPVPQAWDCFEDALWGYEGIGWYSTIINPDDFIEGKIIEIIFGRVMYYSKVWLNGKFIGENIGGYLPFSLDITNYLKANEENKLVVRVDNRTRIEWLPAAGEIEWIQYGGILEPVKLVSKAQTYIEDLIVRTELDDGNAQINCIINIKNEIDHDNELDLNVNIAGSSGIVESSLKVQCKPFETKEVNVRFILDKPELWSPDTPVLYTANATLKRNGIEVDDFTDNFGIRQISIKGTSILLNGEPFIIKGVNRYDFYDEFGPNVPENLLREELSLMKSIGINTIRVHYPQSPELLSLYDEYGFMVIEEILLNWWGMRYNAIGVSEQRLDILDQAKPFLRKMITRDKNHPCIFIWSMANECRTETEIGITVMRELLKLTKKLDPTRLATFVVGGSPVPHLGFDEADLVCFNTYPVCDHISQLDSVIYKPLVKSLENLRKHFNTKPIVVTEFGRHGIKGIHGNIPYCEEFQAAYIETMLKAIMNNPSISGGILWCWADYHHRKTMIRYTIYGPYGVVTGDRKHKKSLETLARMYGGCIPEDKRNP